MADISKISLDGNSYNIKDSEARSDISTLSNVVEGLLASNEFLSNVHINQTRYLGEKGYTTIVYSIIPAGTKPCIRLANNELNSTQLVGDNAHDNKSTLSTNAGILNATTGNSKGTIVIDGEFIRGYQSTDNLDSDYQLLYMTANGNLDVCDSTFTQQQVMALNPVWAIQGFYPLVYNYQTTTQATAHGTTPAERTVIAQNGNGDYLVYVANGRSVSETGLTAIDCINFCETINFVPRILYNLDGGGSSQMAYRGITMNMLSSDTGYLRPVGSFLTWKSDSAKSDGLFDGLQSVDKAIVQQRRFNLPINMNSLMTGASNDISFANKQVFQQGNMVHVSGSVTLSASLANYANISAPTSPLPSAKTTTYIQLIKKDDLSAHLAYIDANGIIKNWNAGALPTGLYTFNFTYIADGYRGMNATLI